MAASGSLSIAGLDEGREEKSIGAVNIGRRGGGDVVVNIGR